MLGGSPRADGRVFRRLGSTAVIMRLIDIMLAFPYILLTIVIVAILGPALSECHGGHRHQSQMPRYARVIRASR
jgi:ABC-type dipeptide/oligopeptide/nickel transport system permease subunit